MQNNLRSHLYNMRELCSPPLAVAHYGRQMGAAAHLMSSRNVLIVSCPLVCCKTFVLTDNQGNEDRSSWSAEHRLSSVRVSRCAVWQNVHYLKDEVVSKLGYSIFLSFVKSFFFQLVCSICDSPVNSFESIRNISNLQQLLWGTFHTIFFIFYTYIYI